MPTDPGRKGWGEAMTPLRRIERQLALELLLLERKLDPAHPEAPEHEAALRLYVDAVESYCKVRALLNPSPVGVSPAPQRAPDSGPRPR